MTADFYDVFLSHNSRDKPAARALCTALTEAGCSVFFDDQDMENDRIAGSEIDAAFDKTLVFAGCWGPAGVGRYQNFELDMGFNFAIDSKFSLITVILPGATPADPGARFRSFPPIIFSHLEDTVPIQKILRVVDRVRGERNLPPRDAGDGSGPVAQPAHRSRQNRHDAAATEEDPYHGIPEQLRRDVRQFGLNFLIGPLTGMEAPSGEDFGQEQNLRWPESGEPSPWEVAHLIKEKGDFLPQDDEDSGVLPLELVASWLSMGKGDSRLVQSRLKTILNTRQKRNSGFYDQLAKVLRLLLETAETTRRRRTPAPMIFTTNFGTNLEWHMMYHGVDFTRVTVKLPDCLIIQSVRSQIQGETLILSDAFDEDSQPLILPRDGDDAEEQALNFLADALPENANRYASSTRQGYRGGVDDYTQPSTARDLSFDDMEGCILFKYHGSIDVDDSCVVNNEQLFELTRIEDLVPSAVEERLKIAPSVVFGTSFLLTEVQQAAEAVWRVPFRATRINRYVVPRAREGLTKRFRDGWLLQMEEAMRDNLKHHASTLNLIEVKPGQEAFLRALEKEFEPKGTAPSMAQTA
ncbi:toll/interleukin-1 receptor domain-containing protein [uncultured Tateyamaria sp.]|uniref:toll/interleukin-1 receptor domain-containing protein n=1 Tax=uncultured Tateyamaria sp. TaxID=455651 RepID=UPI0026254CCA|nr:toll/interleukin-1 receptor domain-containing protein [uncultured Tateyamaria sp.]